MRDDECVALLQWALPRLQLRWAGFRRVRRQVCNRVGRRLRELGLPSAEAYRRYLQEHPSEWQMLDWASRVTISRFWRDRAVFDALAGEILPMFAAPAKAVKVWSAGCASGEEPFSVVLAWHLGAAGGRGRLLVLASDRDPLLLQRARRGCYPPGTLRDLPELWRERAFVHCGSEYCLLAHYRRAVHLVEHDLRERFPHGPFDLILCRNLAFTYFAPELQRLMLARLGTALRPGGLLVIGAHEFLPEPAPGFAKADPKLPIYRWMT